MIKSWEVCLLVYDYLKKHGYTETTLSFNRECVNLQITDPPPNIFSCVLEKIISSGDLEFRLKSFEENSGRAEAESEKIANLEKEMSHIRKRLKKRKKEHSGNNENKPKHRKLSHSKVEKTQHNVLYNDTTQSTLNNSAVHHQTNDYCTDNQLVLSAYDNSMINSSQFTDFQSDSILHGSQISNASLDKYTMDDGEGEGGVHCETIGGGGDMHTPEKRLSSSSRRKNATPKKCKLQGAFIQTLTDNINAKNEEAALDTLNSAEPWLEQFIASLNEPAADADVPEVTQPYNNKEAALSLLALNQSAETESHSTLSQSSMSQSAIMLQQPTIEPLINDKQSNISTPTTSNVEGVMAQLSSGITVSSTNTISNTTVNIHLSEKPPSSSTPQTTNCDNNVVCPSPLPSPDSSTSHAELVASTTEPPAPSPATTITSSSLSLPNEPTSTTNNMIFDPIVIKNKKTLSIAQNNPNMEVIVLPAIIQPQYQHILPKPTQPSRVAEPTPTSYHITQDTAAPVYNFANFAPKPTPQQEAQKFFGQLRRPYHQQLSRIDQLYLVDKTPISTTKRCSFPTSVDAIPTVQDQYQPSPEPGTSEEKNVKPISSFVSWDQKIRQSIIDFKPPLPPSNEKKKRKSRVKDENKQSSKVKKEKVKKEKVKKEKSGEKTSKKKRKSSKNSKKEGSKKSSKSKKKKKKKDIDTDASKKKTITPEFVEESLSSEAEEDDLINLRHANLLHTDPSKKKTVTPEFVQEESLSSDADEDDPMNLRHRQFSESDSVMADMLQKSLKNSSGNSKCPTDNEKCSTPLNSNPLVPLFLNETPVSTEVLENTKTTLTFIEENANSSFDINESTRPKPVFVPEKSQNSCSCNSNHYRESFIKCPEKAFSFKDQDAADSPKYYNENSTVTSTVTVATLFPTLSSSSVSCSPKNNNINISDKQYRSPRLEEDSENDGEDRESDDEIREATSQLPPLSSQNKDLLESSDEEQEGGGNTEPDLIISQELSVNLSESDNDSSSKFMSPIKSARLKLADPKTNSMLSKQEIVPTKAVIVEEDIENKSSGSDQTIKFVEEEIVNKSSESDQTQDVDIASAICIETITDFNDSQELVIDTNTIETNQIQIQIKVADTKNSSQVLNAKNITKDSSTPADPQDAQKSGSHTPENNENANGNIPEDSCDQWYQNVTNKIKPKISFTCERCRKSFPSLAVLTVHSDTCSKLALICSYCGRKCLSKSGLTNHRKTCLTPKSRTRSKEKRKTPSSENKIKINKPKVSPKAGSSSKSDTPKKPLKKKKSRSGKYVDKEIDEFLGNLRYM